MHRPPWPRPLRRAALPRTRRRPRFVPRLEWLEGRALPSTADLIGGHTFLAVEGAQAAPQAIASFTIHTSHIPDGWAAEVTWGDGSVTGANLNLDRDTGLVSIVGSHLYSEEGRYDIAIRLHPGPDDNTIVHSTAEVTDPAVSVAGGFVVHATAGVDSGLQTVATFSDPGGIEPAGDYHAAVAWGDGHSSAGSVHYDESAGHFVVEAGHTYAEAGGYQITATVSHGSAPDAQATSSANVSQRATLLVRGGLTLSSAEGAESSLQALATFIDLGGIRPTNQYDADITWGDGHKGDGVITFDQQTGVFTVWGSHQYAEEGHYRIGVTVSVGEIAAEAVFSDGRVGDPAVVLKAGPTLTSTEGADSGTQILATFTDPGGAEPTSEYSVTISWGDGQSSAGVITYDAGTGVYTVSAGHHYAEEGSYGVSVTVSHGTAKDASVSLAARVADPAVLVAGQFTVQGSEGADSGSQMVATFTDPGGAESADDYHAVIAWGDGTSSEGRISRVEGTDTFTVSGSHIYAEEGRYGVTVTVSHGTAPDASAQSSALVADPAIVLSAGSTLSTVEGADSGLQTLATFSDPGGAEAVGEYSATISWGDGQTSAGTIVYSADTGRFSVLGRHGYQEEGTYSVAVTVSHGSAAAASVSLGATVSDPAIILTGGLTLFSSEGARSGLQALATFTDPGGAEDLSAYSATISWGDGKASGAVIQYDEQTGVFTVLGQHRYADEGNYALTVTVSHGSLDPVAATSSAVVSDPAVILSGGLKLAAVEGADSGLQAVATFTDPGGAESPDSYATVIKWGDGAETAGVVRYDAATGVFTVLGSHTYVEEGTYSVRVLLAHGSAPGSFVLSQATVIDPALVLTAGAALSAVEGADSGLRALATFTDPGGAEPVGEYAATISWGDGSSSAGVIRYDAATGVFTILGNHTYAEEGSFRATVTVAHGDAAAASTSLAVAVGDARLSLAVRNISATEGTAFQGVVASFTDANGQAMAKDFTATVAWGDGTTSAAVVTANGHGGFDVSASHTYADDGSYALAVTVSDQGGSASASAQAVVQALAPSVTLAGRAVARVGTNYVLTVSATEPGTDHLLSLTVNWGDGTFLTVTPNITSGVLVLTHRYTDAPAVDTVSATFLDEDGVHTAGNTLSVTALTAGITDYATATATPGHPGTTDLAGLGEATLSLPANMPAGSSATLFMGSYLANPTGIGPQGFALKYLDLHLQTQGVTDASGATLVVRLDLPDGVNPAGINIWFFGAGRWQLMSGAGAHIGTDAGGRFIEFTITGTSFPRLTALTGSVFTVAVNSTTPAITAILPPVALAVTSGATSDVGNAGGLTSEASFLQSNQLTLVLSTSPESAGSRGGETPQGEARERDDPLARSLDLLLGTVDPLPPVSIESGGKSATSDPDAAPPPAKPDKPDKPEADPSKKADKPTDGAVPPAESADHPGAVARSAARADAFLDSADLAFADSADEDGWASADELPMALAAALAVPLAELFAAEQRSSRSRN